MKSQSYSDGEGGETFAATHLPIRVVALKRKEGLIIKGNYSLALSSNY
jgi:hypothetical protein